MRCRGLLALLLVPALVAACGGDAARPPVAAREFTDPGFVAAEGHELRYGLLPVGDLAAGVALAYGIGRDAQQVVISVSVLKKRPTALPVPVEARVTGNWRGLIGEPQPLEFRPVLTGSAISYVAEAPLRNGEAVVFEIAALPDGVTEPLTARVTREFAARPREP